MKKKWFVLYCTAIVLIISLPLAGSLINLVSGMVQQRILLQEPELSGVVTIPDAPKLSVISLASGEFQSAFENCFSYQLFGRRIMTRVYNQLLYALFHSTDNTEIVVGRESYIYEKPYATAYLTELSDAERNALQYNIAELSRLYNELKKRGVTLVVRLSPSKAEFYPEYLPSSYSRFIEEKKAGEYADNWYTVFTKLIAETNIPVYDCHETLMKLKNEGKVIFAKGGTHWTLAAMGDYINGLNEFLEKQLNRKIGRIVTEDYKVVTGEMGTVDDSDIWRICWNALFATPDYPSPHVTFSATQVEGETPLNVFMIGQSFSTLPLTTIYRMEHPVWNETLFSWYNTRVIQYSQEYRQGLQISESTDDFERYLSQDVIIIEFLENGSGWSQFEFVQHMLEYLMESKVIQ